MSVSLTQDEFLQRFAERWDRFQPLIDQGLRKAVSSLNIRQDKDGIHIDLNEMVGTLMAHTIFGLIDLIYQDAE